MMAQFDCLRYRARRSLLIGWPHLRSWRRRFQAGTRYRITKLIPERYGDGDNTNHYFVSQQAGVDIGPMQRIVSNVQERLYR